MIKKLHLSLLFLLSNSIYASENVHTTSVQRVKAIIKASENNPPLSLVTERIKSILGKRPKLTKEDRKKLDIELKESSVLFIAEGKRRAEDFQKVEKTYLKIQALIKDSENNVLYRPEEHEKRLQNLNNLLESCKKIYKERLQCLNKFQETYEDAKKLEALNKRYNEDTKRQQAIATIASNALARFETIKEQHNIL